MYPDGIGYGNISRRWDATRFAISGTATGGIDEIGPEHFTLVTGFDPEANTLDCLGPVRASAESMTHGAIYRSAPDMNVVIHIHHLDFWERLLYRVPTTDTAVEYGTPAMAGEIERLFAEEGAETAQIICMAGHREGIISFGESAEEAGQTLLRWAGTCGIPIRGGDPE
jgi:hypothetical protein